jgi:carbon monoxide dehydrogenase subunit G
MDKLLNEFTVNRPIEQAWVVLTDVERIAPCMPGAQLQEIEGDVYRGVVKVKLGAIATAFKGQASFLERDDANHRAVLKGEGRDTGGKGNADALITAQLSSVSPEITKVVVETDLRVTGKVAQFGRGIMGDVSKKLMTQFADNLNTMLAQQQDPSDEPVATASVPDVAVEAAVDATTTPAPADAPAAATADAAAHQPAASAHAKAAAEQPTVRKIEGPAAAPIELSGVAGSAVLKRALPFVGGLALLLLILRSLRRK